MRRQELRPFVLLLLCAACGSNDDSKSVGQGSGSGGTAAAGGSTSGAGGSAAGAGGANAGGMISLDTGGAAGACKQEGETCTDSADCCNGGYCNHTGPAPEWLGCHPLCAQDSDCTSGCCMKFQGQNNGFCTDIKWCSCGDTGAPCGTTLPACCDTHACAGNAGGYECRPKCTQASDCPTNCCKQVATGLSVCFDAVNCG